MIRHWRAWKRRRAGIRCLSGAVGPAPWYWQTFPAFEGESGERLLWTSTRTEGDRAFRTLLQGAQWPGRYCFVACTYTRVFALEPGLLGIWYPDGPLLRIRAFNPADLSFFTLGQVPSRAEHDSQRYFCFAEPLGELVIDTSLEPGEHPLSLPAALAGLEHLMLVGGYAKAREAACAAIFEIVRGRASGLRRLRVLPQKWFDQDRFDVGYQWITRVVREPATGRIYGDGFRIDPFELTEDGCHLERWMKPQQK